MKRYILAAMLLMVTSVSTIAQNRVDLSKAFSLGFELGAPAGSAYSIGVGGSGKFELPIVSPVSLTVTAGYSSFFYKSNFYPDRSSPAPAGFIPLKAGIKYYFSDNIGIEGELGSAMETNYQKQGLFAFSVGPGFFIPGRNNKGGVDFGFRYENWGGQLRQTGIRLGYRFGL